MRVIAAPKTLGISSRTATNTTSFGLRVSAREIFSSKAVTFPEKFWRRQGPAGSYFILVSVRRRVNGMGPTLIILNKRFYLNDSLWSAAIRLWYH